MKQRGFSLIESMLAFAIASLLLAMTIPPILSTINQERENIQVNRAINEIFDGMTLAVTAHWQRTQCRSAPSLNLTNLINDYGVPSNVTAKYTPRIEFLSAPTAPYNVRFITITLSTDSHNAATVLASRLKTLGFWLTISGDSITLTQSINVIDSVREHLYYTPRNGCFS